MFGGNHNNNIANSNNLYPMSFGGNNQARAFELFGCNGGAAFASMGNNNEQINTTTRPVKRVRDSSEFFSGQQKYQISGVNNCQAAQFGVVVNPNPVSIGLKLSYEEDEHNSSVSYASDSKMVSCRPVLSMADSLKADLDLQQNELDHQIKLQEENMRKSLRELGERQTMSLLRAVETGIGRKLQEKEVELQNMNRKNNELLERIKQISTEVELWQHRAKYNESVANALTTNLRLVMAQGAAAGGGGAIRVKEGWGDSDEVDSAASCTNQNNANVADADSLAKIQMVCRNCKTKEASMLLLPCRHLCVCKECAGFINACPVCLLMSNGSIEVYT